MAKKPTVPAAMPESEFYMWRAVFAFAMADGELSAEELDLLHEYKEYVHFSARQLQILHDDFLHPQDPELMYKKITEGEDKHRFCIMARALAWSEGDLDKQEERILQHVACLKCDGDYLKKSRDYPELGNFADTYAKGGTMGFLQTPHIIEIRA